MKKAKTLNSLKKTNRLQEAFREIEREEARFRAHAGDPDAAHKLRVRTRALRSLLSFYKPLLKKKDYQHIQSGLRESAARVGRLRELDVLIENYEQAWQHTHEGQGEHSALLSYLVSERKAEEKALLSQIKDGSLRKRRRPAKRFIQGLGSISDIDFEKKRLNQWRREIDSSVEHVADLPYEELHKLRIKTKKARYVLEALEYLLPRIREKEINRLNDLQDKLGDLCDNHRNRDILAEMLVVNNLDEAKLEISSYMSQLNLEEHHIMQTIQDE